LNHVLSKSCLDLVVHSRELARKKTTGNYSPKIPDEKRPQTLVEELIMLGSELITMKTMQVKVISKNTATRRCVSLSSCCLL
jgi:hypothetical protein